MDTTTHLDEVRAMRKMTVVLAGIVAFFLVSLHLAAADAVLIEDLKARRLRFMADLGPETLFIARSAPLQNFSRDVDYEYRQDSNFYYLTGIEQPESLLVLMPGNVSKKEILFISAPDRTREMWEGRTLTRSEARETSGIETVVLSSTFERFLASMLSRRPYRLDPAWKTRAEAFAEFRLFHGALDNNRGRLALILETATDLSSPVSSSVEFANRLRERFFGFTITDVSDILYGLRQVKTPYERRMLEESAEVSSAAHLAAMRAARAGAFEFEVEAALEAVFLSRGALGWSYPSIVASGPNATTLHYSTSRRKIEDGDLLLIDAAANYRYMTVDITRTYPVNGRFTQPQNEIYQIVLAAQEAGIKAARIGATVQDIEDAVTDAIKNGLLKINLIAELGGNEYRRWYPHPAVHFIGMDVHDVGDYSSPLAPGVAFVIEPGLYIREDAIAQPAEGLPALSEKVRVAAEKYKNIGVRIEDSFLLTEQGLKNLSAQVPRTVADIEKFLQSRSSRAQ